MARKARPTDAEMEILQFLWLHGPSTVRAVHEELAHSKPVGYTTTLKMMQIMHDKGTLTRDEAGKAHVYAPTQATRAAKEAILSDFIDRVFGGSAADLVLHALGQKVTNKQELDSIKKMISDLEGEK